MDFGIRATTIKMCTSQIGFDSKICRLCLSKCITYFSIIDNGTASDMLEALTSIKITSNDEISTVMCLKCRLNLTLAYAIQQNMIKAEERFKYQPPLAIKQESDSLEVTQENQEMVSVLHEEIIINKTEPDEDPNALNFNTYSCGICDRTFATPRLRNRHKYNHTLRKCPICSKEVKATNLRKHINSHTRKNQDTSSVVSAKEQFKNQPSEVIKKESVPLEATQENQEIASVLDEEIPINETKPAEDPNALDFSTYLCEICGQTFTTRLMMVRHKYNHLRRKCPICSKEVTATNMRVHVDSHTSPYSCMLCGRNFSSRRLRKRHKCSHPHHIHPYPHTTHICTLCGAIFKAKPKLQHHMIYVHKGSPHDPENGQDAPVPKELCVCHTCGKRFCSVETLNAHLRLIHTGEAPYQCDVCGEGFKYRAGLKSHQKSKHNIIEKTKWKCEVCGKVFRIGLSLWTHQRVHLKNV